VTLARELHGSSGRTAVIGPSPSTPQPCSCRPPSCWSACLGILLIAERRIPAPADEEPGPGLDASHARQAVGDRSSVVEKVATKAGIMQTEVFPLTLFAIGGMLLFPPPMIC